MLVVGVGSARGAPVMPTSGTVTAARGPGDGTELLQTRPRYKMSRLDSAATLQGLNIPVQACH